MKKSFLLVPILSIFAFCSAYAQSDPQPLPPATLIPHYVLPVGYNSTTVLVFPATVKPVDRGDRDVLAQKQPGVDNVLKVKAARKNFPTTNLHVFTSDGRIYAFNITYTDSLPASYNLKDLAALSGAGDATAPTVEFSAEPVNSEQMSRYVNAIKGLHPEHIARNSHDRMVLRLQRIGQTGPLLLFRFKITNRSNLDYTPDFVRLYIRDAQKAKRTSVQEQEISPVYEDTLSIIPGGASRVHILAVPAFTLANGKEFLVEVYEKGGGRSMTLRLGNKALFKVAKF